MEAMGHFLFELIKIAVLSSIYAAVFLFCRSIFLKHNKENADFTKAKFKRVHIIIYSLLLVFSFTYYGNHGLGDSYNIPLGHWESMSAGDLYAYFTPSGTSNQISVSRYEVRGNNLCASVDSGYMIYNLNTKKMIKFDTEPQYNAYALSHELPDSNEFLDFFKQYNVYWNGWRFWILP